MYVLAIVSVMVLSVALALAAAAGSLALIFYVISRPASLRWASAPDTSDAAVVAPVRLSTELRPAPVPAIR
jgi:hypothetical protein